MTFYIDESATPVKGSKYLYFNVTGTSSSGMPNETIYYSSPGYKLSNPSYDGSINVTLTTDNTFHEGTYAIVISGGSNTIYYSVVPDSMSKNMWTYDGSTWNSTPYPADIPFYYNYTVLSDNPSQAFYYQDPQSVNFTVNTILCNYSSSFNAVSQSSFNITSNTSISFNINLYLIFVRNANLSISTGYEIVGNDDYWTTNFTISPFTTPINSVVIRNFTLLNIPSDWKYNGQIYNGSSPYNPYNTFPDLLPSAFMFQVLGSSVQGNFKVVFITLNYISSLDIFNVNNQLLSNSSLFINDIYHFAGTMYPSPSISGNISMVLYNSTNSLIIKYSNPNASILNNYLVFPSFNISKYFPPNSQFQGSYTLIFFWANPNLTKVGYYQMTIYFIIQTKLALIAKNGFVNITNNNTVKLSTSVNMLFTFTNLLSTSLISNSTTSFFFTNQYGENNTNLIGLTANSTSDKINVTINTNPTLDNFYRIGNFNLTIVVSKFGFETQIQSFLFTITGFNIKIDLSYNQKILRGQDFTVRAVVTSSDPVIKSLFLKTVSYTTQPVLSNLLIILRFDIVFQNNTQATVSTSSFTDQTGTAYLELSSTVTRDLKSINKMETDFNGNNLINTYENVVLNPTISFISSSGPISFVTIIMIILSIIIIVAVILGVFYFYNFTLLKSRESNQKYDDYINALTDFLGMYITNKDGLPVFLKSNQRSEDQNQHLMLSGVTYSIDLFLSNFKEEYTRTITKDSYYNPSDNTGLVNMTVIDQQNFKILIGVSDSYRMYVLITQTNPGMIKLFQNVLDNIERTIKIERTIINLQQVYPFFVNEIEKEFPIEIVNEFEVKFERLVNLITDSTQTLVSSSTINKLKDLCIYLVKNSNISSSIELPEDFDFKTLINKSDKIKIQRLTLPALNTILERIHCSKKQMYEIYYICSGSKVSIFRNITPINIPETSSAPTSD